MRCFFLKSLDNARVVLLYVAEDRCEHGAPGRFRGALVWGAEKGDACYAGIDGMQVRARGGGCF